MKWNLQELCHQRILPKNPLSVRHSHLLITGLALLLVSPSLLIGFQVDDYLQRGILLSKTSDAWPAHCPPDLFAFTDGNPARNYKLIDRGIMPWWTPLAFKARFFRPLASLTHAFDYRVYPDSPCLMHAHNLLWLLLLIVSARAFYRQLSHHGFIPATLALLFFAFDDARGYPAGWIANRNVLIAGVFGFSAIRMHLLWRETLRIRFLFASLSLYLLALLSSEAGIAVMCYIMAALFLEQGTHRVRWIAMLPSSAMTAAWWIAHHAAGYGTYGSGMYRDPLVEPIEFFRSITANLPILLESQFGIIPASLASISGDGTRTVFWAFCVLFCSALAYGLYPFLRTDRTARFLATGTLLSVLPICATFPHERLLVFTGLGASGLIAQLIAHTRTEPLRLSMSLRVLSVIGLLFHGILAPLLLPLSAISPVLIGESVAHLDQALPIDSALPSDSLILINPPIPFLAHHVLIRRETLGRVTPEHFRVLGPGTSSIHVTRLSEDSIRFDADPPFLTAPLDRLFRGPSIPLLTGTVIDLSDMRLRVLSSGAILCDLKHSADSGRYRWFCYDQNRIVPFVLPQPGSMVRLDPQSVLPFMNVRIRSDRSFPECFGWF